EKYQYFDAEYRFALQVPPVGKEKGRHCLCENILQGENPRKCPHFATGCTPAQPLGPCMVSREGACLICYNKGRS
ncbi:MAG: hydrogenase formation protein HypD, partial [Bacillota bacterium]